MQSVEIGVSGVDNQGETFFWNCVFFKFNCKNSVSSVDIQWRVRFSNSVARVKRKNPIPIIIILLKKEFKKCQMQAPYEGEQMVWHEKCVYYAESPSANLWMEISSVRNNGSKATTSHNKFFKKYTLPDSENDFEY